MAYAAVISLKHTIQHLLNSSRISIVSPSRQILEFTYNEANSLQDVLIRIDNNSSSNSNNKRLNVLDGQIREAVHALEDKLESHEVNQFFSQSGETSYGDDSCFSSHRVLLSLDLEELRKEIRSAFDIMKKMKEEYIHELDNPRLPGEHDDDEAVSSSIHVDSGVDNLVGLSHVFADTMHDLVQVMRPDDYGVFGLIGVAGTGRTAVAKTLFEDQFPGQETYFDFRAWVSIGQKYQYKEILLNILAQMNDLTGNDHGSLTILGGDEKKMGEYLYANLKGKRYMIMLDDLRDAKIWHQLKSWFPEQDNGSLVFVTTSLKEVALSANCTDVRKMRVHDEEFIWQILWLGLINAKLDCPEFEEVGKKIVENCRGVIFVIVKVFLFLMKAERTVEYWKKLAADKENSVFNITDEISEINKIKDDLELLNNGYQTAMYAEVMMNLDSVFEETKLWLFPERFFPHMKTFFFYGMAGIGKTAIVKKIFNALSNLNIFHHCVWVTLGQQYQPKDILMDILAQIYPDISRTKKEEHAKLCDMCTQLSDKRCLIVLDDVWNPEPLYYIKKLLPDIRGKFLVTSRLARLAQFGKCDKVLEMNLLDEEASWCLFRDRVFPNGICPPGLEKPGKRISKNCDGLPLLILTVADLISKSEKTPEYWNKVADKRSLVFVNAHDQISKTLLPSYERLPQHLKICFLYMGVFNQDYEVPTSKLINLWIAEGLLDPNVLDRDFILEYLSELYNNSLLLVCKNSSRFKIKTCRLHSVFWHLSNSKAIENKLFYALNTCVDSSVEGMQSQRRLCIRNNVLLGIKDVYSSIASVSTARSLLCTSPPHQYPVPVGFGLRLLKILDALTIRFHEFPIEVVKLIHLKYLALTYNGKLPASVSKLWNLQYLIVRRHLSIYSSKDSLFLPVEIWDMRELRHLQVEGSNLPEPSDDALLPNLITLLDVTPHSCSESILKRIPNLKKLGIRIPWSAHVDKLVQKRLSRVSRFQCIESLKCVFMHPEFVPQVVAPPAPRFPLTLKKLSLSGYPWEHMNIVGNLKILEVIKLRCYAFRGPKWVTGYNMFMNVKYLSIEDTDLVCWKPKLPSFAKVTHISIKHCYKLEELPLFCPFKMIEIVDCNPRVTTWANQMEGRFATSVAIHSSWDAEKVE